MDIYVLICILYIPSFFIFMWKHARRTIAIVDCARGGGHNAAMYRHDLHVPEGVSPSGSAQRLLGRGYAYVGVTEEGVVWSTSTVPQPLKNTPLIPAPFSSSPAPEPTERVSLGSLPALICELQAAQATDASTAAVHELRKELARSTNNSSRRRRRSPL